MSTLHVFHIKAPHAGTTWYRLPMNSVQAESFREDYLPRRGLVWWEEVIERPVARR